MDLFRVWSTWEGAPCQVGTRPIKLIGLSCKSTFNICTIWSDLGTVLATGPGVQFAVPEMKDEEEKMCEKPGELKEREKKISVDIDNAMDCIKEVRNLIKEGRMRDNMVIS